jgi:tetratricopeptide (TPR) repeat protein
MNLSVVDRPSDTNLPNYIYHSAHACSTMDMTAGRGVILLLSLLVVCGAVPVVCAEVTAGITTVPTTATGWYEQGNSYVNEGRYDGALYAYDMAIALNPDYARAYFAKGQVLATIGRHSDALEAYEKAIALDPALMAVVDSYFQASEKIVYPDIPSGSLITGSWVSGWNYLVIDNRLGTSDLVIALAPFESDGATTAVYVKKGYYHEFNGIVPPGSYAVYVTYGNRWNAKEKRFDQNAGYLRWALPQYFPGTLGYGYTMTFIGQLYQPNWFYYNLEPIPESAFPNL